MDKQKLNKAIKHARITVKEVQHDSIYYSPDIRVRAHPRTDYNYTINISDLNLRDMKAFMDWFKEINHSWLEGIEQDFDDGWNLH